MGSPLKYLEQRSSCMSVGSLQQVCRHMVSGHRVGLKSRPAVIANVFCVLGKRKCHWRSCTLCRAWGM